MWADGGLFVALAESAMSAGMGFSVRCPENMRKDTFLFGEAQGRAIVGVSPDAKDLMEEQTIRESLTLQFLGEVKRKALVVDGAALLSVEEANEIYHSTLAQYLG